MRTIYNQKLRFDTWWGFLWWCQGQAQERLCSSLPLASSGQKKITLAKTEQQLSILLLFWRVTVNVEISIVRNENGHKSLGLLSKSCFVFLLFFSPLPPQHSDQMSQGSQSLVRFQAVLYRTIFSSQWWCHLWWSCLGLKKMICYHCRRAWDNNSTTTSSS